MFMTLALRGKSLRSSSHTGMASRFLVEELLPLVIG
jgi:hypothetical protein